MMEPPALHPPDAVHDIAAKLRSHGHQAWAVGGALRDALLGSPAVDWDIATSARPDDMRSIFRRTVPIGVEHGTLGVLWKDGVMYEVTTFRRDVETDGRHAVVAFADTIEEDLARRDFTFNALAWDPATGELRDPYGGVADLKNDIVRTVGDPTERFAEDYLRVLRALRFAGQLGCTIEPATWSALERATAHLQRLSPERVREELFKVLGKTRAASRTLALYRQSGALAALYPELAATVAVTETGDESAGSDDVWQRSLRSVDAIPPTRLHVRLAALLHGLGMPAARTRSLRGGFSFVGHEAIGARKAAELLERLRASNADIDRVRDLVALQSTLFPPDAPDAGIRRWLQHVDTSRVRDLMRLRIALWRAQPVAGGADDLCLRWRRAHEVMLMHPVLTTTALAIDGRDLKALGLTPGPQFGAILRALLERVVEDPALNTSEQLTALAREELQA
jgi:tRNA nucleotidyltransferase/poly(A) polymerase